MKAVGGAVTGGWECDGGLVLGYGNAFGVESVQWEGGGGYPPPLSSDSLPPPPRAQATHCPVPIHTHAPPTQDMQGPLRGRRYHESKFSPCELWNGWVYHNTDLAAPNVIQCLSLSDTEVTALQALEGFAEMLADPAETLAKNPPTPAPAAKGEASAETPVDKPQAPGAAPDAATTTPAEPKPAETPGAEPAPDPEGRTLEQPPTGDAGPAGAAERTAKGSEGEGPAAAPAAAEPRKSYLMLFTQTKWSSPHYHEAHPQTTHRWRVCPLSPPPQTKPAPEHGNDLGAGPRGIPVGRHC